MTRLSWGEAGKRLFEAGADRGVLFPRQTAGVSWSGIVSVSEAPSGGDVTPLYYDGVKYHNFIAAEDFQAVLEAYGAPREFDACDGTKALSPGLFATQQPRWPFSMSYRTLIGNDIDSIDHGYKLHLVYNCMAQPASVTHKTLGANPDPTTKQWTTHTVPPPASTFKPTAHFVVDSTLTTAPKLKALEDIIYGTALADSRMPTQAEVIALL